MHKMCAKFSPHDLVYVSSNNADFKTSLFNWHMKIPQKNIKKPKYIFFEKFTVFSR